MATTDVKVKDVIINKLNKSQFQGIETKSNTETYFINDEGLAVAVDKLSNLNDVNISSAENNQVLQYDSNEYKWKNKTISTETSWGSITGTLSDQSDLNTALNAKQDKLTAGDNITIDANNKISADDVVWGDITGTLSNQTDLNTALNNRIERFLNLPTASADYENRVVQYVGTNLATTHTGWFYICKNVSGTYKWVELNAVLNSLDQDAPYQPLSAKMGKTLNKNKQDKIEFDTMPDVSGYLGEKTIIIFTGEDIDTYQFGHSYQSFNGTGYYYEDRNVDTTYPDLPIECPQYSFSSENNKYYMSYNDESSETGYNWDEMYVETPTPEASEETRDRYYVDSWGDLVLHYGKSGDLQYWKDVTLKEIPTTSTAGKVLKSTSTEGTVEWGDASSGATWGSITGTLSAQTDLQNALNAKQATINSTNKLSATLVDGLATVATSGSYNDLSGTPTVPTKVSELTGDVTISEPEDGQVLSYSSNKWINKTPTVITSLSQLTGDVTISEPANNQILKYNGTKWVNTTEQDISGKADKATTLSGYGITDAKIEAITGDDTEGKKITLGTEVVEVYTKAEVKGKLTGAFHYKGSVTTTANLPLSDNTQGDVYNVTESGMNYAWKSTSATGSLLDWDALGTVVDLSIYQKITDDTLSTTSKTVPGAINEVKTTADTVASKISGITATVAEINKLHNLATTATELGYVSGVTSAIQTQIDGKSTVSVSATGTTTETIGYITVDGTEKKILTTTIEDVLTSTSTTNALSANMGKSLNDSKADKSKSTFDESMTNLGTATSNVTIDTTSANCFKLELGADITVSLTTDITSTSGNCKTVSLLLNPHSYSITWPTYIRWSNDTAPTFTDGKLNLITFITFDGNSWFTTCLDNLTETPA